MTRPSRPDRKEAEAAIALVISYLGDDPRREGLVNTPSRVISALEGMLAGYDASAGKREREPSTYSVCSAGLIEVRDVAFSSYCEHHMMLFIGTVDVAYRPAGKSISAADLQWLVRRCAARLQTQERLTTEIADRLSELVEPQGLGVQVQSVHTCMAMRGAMKPDASTVTSAFRGTFLLDEKDRRLFTGLR